MKNLFFTLIFIFVASTVLAAGDPVAGKAKYDTLCVTCHGASGAGDGVAAASLNPKPRNFSDKAAMSTRTDDQLSAVIKNGGASAGLSASMPPWGAMLNDADIANVVAYIRTLAK